MTLPKAPLTLALEDKPDGVLRCGETFKPKIIISSAREEEFELHYTALSKGNIVKTGVKKITAVRKENYNPYESKEMVELSAVEKVNKLRCGLTNH